LGPGQGKSFQIDRPSRKPKQSRVLDAPHHIAFNEYSAKGLALFKNFPAGLIWDQRQMNAHESK
jgi:hypothetical protein